MNEQSPVIVEPPPGMSAWPSGIAPVSIRQTDSSWEGVRTWTVHAAGGEIGRLEHDGKFWRGVRRDFSVTPRRRLRWQTVADLVDRHRAGTGASRYA